MNNIPTYLTPEYRAWQGMKDRCYNINSIPYKSYGGRGIVVCDEWKNSFSSFLLDMGKRPSNLYSIDRYPNNDGNYEPNNCRWATKKEQAINRRSSNFIEYDGERLTVSDMAIKLGVSQHTIYDRIIAGHSPFEHRQKKLILDMQTGIYYLSVKEAAFVKNISTPYLTSQLNGGHRNKSNMIYV